MNKMSKILGLLLVAFVATTFISCDDDDDNTTTSPITLGSEVTINNTFQSETMTGGEELLIEQLFGMDEGALYATATVSDAVEFPAYLLGLYDIDIAENSITYTLVAQEDDATYGSLFRTIEAGSYDRYYLNFDTAQNVTGFTSSDPAVTLIENSDTQLVVQIGEGFEFQPGTTFTITLN